MRGKRSNINNTRLVIKPDKEIVNYMRLIVWLYSLHSFQVEFARLVAKITRVLNANGNKFTVQYFKQVHLCLLKHLAGDRFELTSPPISLDKNQLPSILPVALRVEILRRNEKVIRGVLAMSSIYRVISFPGEVKLNTITDLPRGEERLLDKEVLGGVKALLAYLPDWTLSPLDFSSHMFKPPVILSSGPNNPISILGAPLDALAYFKYPKELGNFIMFAFHMRAWLVVILLISSAWLILPWYIIYRAIGWTRPLYLGRLCEKAEPAGKVRIFAIADYWRQWLLKPVHDRIFTLLRSIPMDGTFNQAAPLDRLIQLGVKEVYSYDLSAATDRLPRLVQVQVLNFLFGVTFMDWWGKLFAGDWYYKYKPYRYSTGQAMGAYSSWASLAITHHAIVQIAAIRVNQLNFEKYAVLGDDVVIADKAVALSYLHIMQVLGVEISSYKSLTSVTGSFEFAKRIIAPGRDGTLVEYTPAGPAAILLAIRNPKNLPSLVIDTLGKGAKYTERQLSSMLEVFPFKVTSLWREAFKQIILITISSPKLTLPRSANARWLWGYKIPGKTYYQQWLSTYYQAALEAAHVINDDCIDFTSTWSRLSFKTFTGKGPKSFGRVRVLWTSAVKYIDIIWMMELIFRSVFPGHKPVWMKSVSSIMNWYLESFSLLSNIGYYILTEIARRGHQDYRAEFSDKKFEFRKAYEKGIWLPNLKAFLPPVNIANSEYMVGKTDSLLNRELVKVSKDTLANILENKKHVQLYASFDSGTKFINRLSNGMVLETRLTVISPDKSKTNATNAVRRV